MGRILLLRHGQADLLGDDYDRLSDLGRDQARHAGRALAAEGMRPSLVVSGGLRRQTDTAQAAVEAAGWSATCEIDGDLDEYAHHDLFTPSFPQLPDHAAIAAHVAGQPDPRRAYQDLFETAFRTWSTGGTADGSLSWAAFRDRRMAALKRVAMRRGRGESALVVTSGGVIAALVQVILGVPDEQVIALHNPLYNASITRLMNQGERIALSGFNDISHLARPDLAGLVTYR